MSCLGFKALRKHIRLPFGVVAALFVALLPPATAAPIEAVSPEASPPRYELSAQERAELDQAWRQLLGRADPYNGQSLYIAQQNGTPLAHAIFVLGDADMQARLLAET